MKRFRKRRNQNHTVFTGSSGKDSVHVFPLGGISGVTKNMFVYEYRLDGKIRDILLVDCGIGFPDPEMYGVDLLIPDVTYLQDKKRFIRGLVFTHGHDDHIGAIPYIYPKLGNIPMWGTTLTAAFANLKLSETDTKQRVKPVQFSDTLSIGAFRVSFVRMTHSVPDTSNLVIRTPVGIIYHASDFKFDFDPLDGKHAELEKINAVGREGVLCMLTDCLGSERRGFTQSERIIADTLRKELDNCPGKIIFTTQSSNISRIQLAIDLAQEYGRSVAFLGRSIDKNVEEAAKLGYMNFPREILLRDADLRRLPAPKQFLIVAGSQGQPGSALSRIANDAHKFVKIEEGDTVVFSADPIPGNEHGLSVVMDLLYKKGARVSYSDIMEDLHVSGHGSQGDLMLLLSALGPRYVMPIGGTYRHMIQYRRLAQSIGYHKKQILIPEDGEVLSFTRDAAPQVVATVDLDTVMIDGIGEDLSQTVLRDRQTLASDGIVVVVIPIDKSTGRVTAEPDIISRGFVYIKENEDLIQKARKAVVTSMKLKKGRIIDWQFVRTQIRKNVEKVLGRATGRYPLIVPVIIEV